MTSGKLVDALVIKEVFQSVSDSKAAIASAITDKGIETDATDSFEVMAENIRRISQNHIHKYIDGVCTECGAADPDYSDVQVGTQAELGGWNYKLDGDTIKLTSYYGAETDIIIYGQYAVDGIVYNTNLSNQGTSYTSGPFYNKCKNITSIKILNGVVSDNCAYLFYTCSALNSIDLSG